MSRFLYDPSQGPVKVFFLFSGGASSMRAVLDDPNHGKSFLVIGAACNRDYDKAQKGYGLAARIDDLSKAYIDPSKHNSRESYYAAVLERIEAAGADVVGLSGWLKKYSLISEPLISGFQNRIINVHPAELSAIYNPGADNKHPLDIGRTEMEMRMVRAGNDVYGSDGRMRPSAWSLVKDKKWKRMLTGDDAVFMAALLGETEVCSTIHSVTEECDGGPILVQSKRLPVDTEHVEKLLARNAYDRLAVYAHKLQGEMKTDCDGPAFCEALELLGTGRMGIDDDHAILDGKDLPYGGYQME